MFSIRLLTIILALLVFLNFNNALPQRAIQKLTTTTKATTKTTTKPTTTLKLATTNKPITKTGSYNLITSSSDTEPKVWSLTNGQLNYTLSSNPANNDIQKFLVIENKYFL